MNFARSLPSVNSEAFGPPKAPVFGWHNWHSASVREVPGVQRLPHQQTTSGRAALFQALRCLNLPPGSSVLVPTYHCPTMVAPVLCAGLQVRYYGIGCDGLPLLDRLEAQGSKAMIVAHLFGIGRSLHDVRRWCDEHQVALIEDCAHCLFGTAGERMVGAWGDLATASLSKFLPVPEAGLLASAVQPLKVLQLERRGLRDEVKGIVDVLEFSAHHERLGGLNRGLRWLFDWKNRRKQTHAKSSPTPVTPTTRAAQAEAMMVGADMQRATMAPLAVSRWIGRALPVGRVVHERREHFAAYARGLTGLAGTRPLFADAPEAFAPYVYPLWVDDVDRVYEGLRAAKAPVFRWDRIWPGTSQTLPGDQGPAWSRHVLQLLCHQDLTRSQVTDLIRLLHRLVDEPGSRP